MFRSVVSEYPAGSIIVPSSGHPRFNTFYMALSELIVPAGTRLHIGNSSDVCLNMNVLMDEAKGSAWYFILGDDHVFESDVLMRLLKWGLPAVVALNVQRMPPYWPVVLQGIPGPELRNLTWEDMPTGTGLWYPPKDIYAGNAGLLLSATALDRLSKPYFRAGQFDASIVNEDIWLMHSLKLAGVPVPIDLSVVLGHSSNLTAVPVWTGESWKVDFYYSRAKKAFRITPQSKSDDPGRQ